MPVGIGLFIGIVVVMMMEEEDVPTEAKWMFVLGSIILLGITYIPERLIYRLLTKPKTERSYWKTKRIAILKQRKN